MSRTAATAAGGGGATRVLRAAQQSGVAPPQRPQHATRFGQSGAPLAALQRRLLAQRRWACPVARCDSCGGARTSDGAPAASWRRRQRRRRTRVGRNNGVTGAPLHAASRPCAGRSPFRASPMCWRGNRDDGPALDLWRKFVPTFMMMVWIFCQRFRTTHHAPRVTAPPRAHASLPQRIARKRREPGARAAAPAAAQRLNHRPPRAPPRPRLRHRAGAAFPVRAGGPALRAWPSRDARAPAGSARGRSLGTAPR
jgi:hypothetical protein